MTTGFSDSSFEFAQGSVYGFRTWFMIGGDLEGSYAYRWFNPVKNATCFKLVHKDYLENIVPHPECTCGIYAYWSPYCPLPVSGVIEGSGRTIIGTQGFRTQKARIKALCFDIKLVPDFAEITGVTRREIRLKEIAKQFEVPLYCDVDDMLAEHPLTTDYLPADSNRAGSQ